MVRRIIGVVVTMVALGVMGADPYVGCIYPAGVQAGTTNRLVVGGQFFWNIRGAVAGAGVHVLDCELVPSFPVPTGDQRKYLVKWLDQIAGGDRAQPRLPVENEHYNEWRSNRWYSTLGELDVGQLAIVERWLHTPRNPLQMSPSLSQKLLVTVAVDADAVPGPREFRVFNPAGVSPPRPLLVTAAPRIAEPLYVPPHRAQPATPVVTNIPCALDGQIMPGATDRWILPLAKGRTITLRATAREFQPYIGDAVPGFFNAVLRILDRQGNELAFADDFHYHPDPVLTFTAPADGDYTLEIHDNLYRGREDFVYSIDIRDGAWAPPLHELSLSPLPAWDVPSNALVRVYRGVVKEPGKPAQHTFTVKEPGELCFDLLARRAGSPLDARVTVWKSGREVARVDDVTNAVHFGSVIQAECDPVGRVKFDEPGKYTLRIEDEAGRGGPDYSYTLRLHRPAPRFEVWCLKSGISLRAWWGGQRVSFKVVRRDGFSGDVRLEETPTVRFTPAVIPAASNQMTVVMISKLQRPCTPTNIALVASGMVDGGKVTVPVVPANEYNQAFAWDHLIPAREFILNGLPGNPPKPRKVLQVQQSGRIPKERQKQGKKGK